MIYSTSNTTEFISIILFCFFTLSLTSQVHYVDENVDGNWMWQEVIEYDTNKVHQEEIVDILEQWFLRKKASINAKMFGDYEQYRIDNNIIQKDSNYIKGFLNESIARTSMNPVVMRFVIQVEVREGRFRVTFLNCAMLATIALDVHIPLEGEILTQEWLIKKFKKKKGTDCFDCVIGKWLEEIEESVVNRQTEETHDDW